MEKEKLKEKYNAWKLKVHAGKNWADTFDFFWNEIQNLEKDSEISKEALKEKFEVLCDDALFSHIQDVDKVRIIDFFYAELKN